MSSGKWLLIKQRKNFYIDGYRIGVLALIGSFILNCIFCLLIGYYYFTEPEPSYYATNGITALVDLQALAEPNNSSKALLEPDPAIQEQGRRIPE